MKTVRLSEFFESDSLTSREQLRELHEEARNEKMIVLDFSDINFISPSAAHEIAILSRKMKVKCINAPEEIKDMFNIQIRLRNLRINEENLSF